MPPRRHIVSMLCDFGIFAPFAFSPRRWRFSALCCTSRASRCSRLKQSVTFRSAPCCWDSHESFVALKSASRVNCNGHTAKKKKLNFSFQSPCTGRLASLSNIFFFHSSDPQQPTNVPTFTSSTRRRCGDFRSRWIVGNVVLMGNYNLTYFPAMGEVAAGDCTSRIIE